MSSTLDLNLLPVARYAGQDYPQMVGLHVAEPPRRLARGRTADRLVLYLAVVEDAPLPPGKQEKALADLARLFYETPGSVTAACRVVAEELNTLLLERNLRNQSSGRRGFGLFTQVVLRGQQVYLAQSGPVHAFLIAAGETQHLYDPGMSDHYLGQSRSTPITYSQLTLQPNDTLLLAALPSPSWSESALASVYGQGPESLRRRLFNQADLDLNAVLIQAKSGKGKFYLPPPLPAQAGEAEEEMGEAYPSLPAAAVASPASLQAAPLQAEPAVEASGDAQRAMPAPTSTSSDQAATAAVAASIAEKPAAAKAAQRRAGAEPLKPLASSYQRLGTQLRAGLARLLPGEVFVAIPSYVMALIAVVVPVVVVTVASAAYFQLGRDAQYELLYAQAQQMAQQAAQQTDPAARRAGLEAALGMLLQAEAYQTTPETQALRLQTRSALDDLDLIRRVQYEPAIVGGLPASVSVRRIFLSDRDLYLLDGNSGSVIRLILKDQVYQVDQTFQCGPGTAGVSAGGLLIDAAVWPADYKPQASLAAVDGQGGVLYCRPDDSPTPAGLAVPDVEAWGSLAGVALDGDFYVLDLPSNMVWIYERSNLEEVPTQFFDQEIPLLQDVIDLAVNRNDLYLLHRDGHTTLCLYGGAGVSPTRCSEPAYLDLRSGQENLPLAPPAPFSQLQITSPPDPSLFMLEPKSQAIYHFSLRNLAFQRQYLPENPLPLNDATAFAVDTLQRTLFIAIGNEVYYAVMP